MTSSEEKTPDSDQGKTPLRRMQFNVAKDATKAEMAEALTDQLLKQMFGEQEEEKSTKEEAEEEADEDWPR